MKRKKIKIIEEKGGYMMGEAETRRAVDLLEESGQFWEGIESLRNKYQIPENGFPEFSKKYDLPGVLSNKDGTISYVDEFFEDAQELTRKLNLPIFWWSSIAYFAAYGIFFTPEESTFALMFDRTPRGGVFKLFLEERVGRSKFHKLIDENWEFIASMMERMPASPKHKMARVALAKEIAWLRDEEELTFGQISERLSSRYEKDRELSDLLATEDNVKMLYYRWKRTSQIQGYKSNTYSQ